MCFFCFNLLVAAVFIQLAFIMITIKQERILLLFFNLQACLPRIIDSCLILIDIYSKYSYFAQKLEMVVNKKDCGTVFYMKQLNKLVRNALRNKLLIYK